ncbi:MAG: cyclic nucleotide-binding domain-containing protein [Treponema sp.]|jgi:CRP-like cAMP-binding protein|nr:cyclic nucleotide-binding domain-containing protein [Treponema sp.]
MTLEVPRLQKYALFGGLSEDQIAGVLPYLEERRFLTGQTILKEGDRNDRVFFILEGNVIVRKDGITLAEFDSGDAVGEMEILGVRPASATLLAMSDVKTVSLSNTALYKIYKEDIHTYAMIILNLARELSRRLRRMNEYAAQREIESE